jgi:hypothetical protein
VTEWKLFDGDVPAVSTAEFHEHRERAPHLDQPHHWPRLHVAGQYLREAASEFATWSDLGCGDGGLLSLVQDAYARAWGYDFQPSNAAGWAQRRVTAYQLDVFGKDRHLVELGNVVSCTEVLEHLADPHGVLRWLYEAGVGNSATRVDTLVCSSPVNEDAHRHDECHAWAWDKEGYAAMVETAGWDVYRHEVIGPFQVVWATG